VFSIRSAAALPLLLLLKQSKLAVLAAKGEMQQAMDSAYRHSTHFNANISHGKDRDIAFKIIALRCKICVVKDIFVVSPRDTHYLQGRRYTCSGLLHHIINQTVRSAP
jgi:hypothetical protein